MGKPVTKLKEVREKRMLNLADLSKLSGVAIGTISKAENQGKISFTSIKRLAEALKVQPDRLL